MRKLNLKNAIAISIGLHLIWSLFVFLQKPTPPPETSITVDLLTENLPPSKEHRKKQEPKIKQIVEQDQTPINNEKPKKEAFLSAHDQRVERETRASEHGEFQNHHQQKTSKAGGQQQTQTKPTLKDFLGKDALAKHQEAKQGDGKQDAQASQSNDYLKNVDVGNETMLNTREFKYFTYYSRIRKQLAQYWEPKVRQKVGQMFKQGRKIASTQDHITKLLITLNNQGQLVRVQVLDASGVQDLDDAATEAFRAAAPFPNPPQGIVEDDGTVKIRWDFVLES
jgi:protein TonB